MNRSLQRLKLKNVLLNQRICIHFLPQRAHGAGSNWNRWIWNVQVPKLLYSKIIFIIIFAILYIHTRIVITLSVKYIQLQCKNFETAFPPEWIRTLTSTKYMKKQTWIKKWSYCQTLSYSFLEILIHRFQQPLDIQLQYPLEYFIQLIYATFAGAPTRIDKNLVVAPFPPDL